MECTRTSLGTTLKAFKGLQKPSKASKSLQSPHLEGLRRPSKVLKGLRRPPQACKGLTSKALKGLERPSKASQGLRRSPKAFEGLTWKAFEGLQKPTWKKHSKKQVSFETFSRNEGSWKQSVAAPRRTFTILNDSCSNRIILVSNKIYFQRYTNHLKIPLL